MASVATWLRYRVEQTEAQTHAVLGFATLLGILASIGIANRDGSQISTVNLLHLLAWLAASYVACFATRYLLLGWKCRQHAPRSMSRSRSVRT